MENIIDQGELHALYNRVKGVVWLLEASKPGMLRPIFTGVCVRGDGLVMVGVSVWNDMQNTVFKARRIDDVGLLYDATRVSTENFEKKCGIALFKIEGIVNCVVGNFVNDGSLNEGEPIMYVGHPGDLVWSLIPTTVGFRCIDGVDIPNNDMTCATYEYDPAFSTPEYRKLGHIFNQRYFGNMDSTERLNYELEMARHPEIPVIQCNGLLNCVKSGGPLFNKTGGIVGLLSSEFKCFTFAIHVSTLKQFLQLATTDILRRKEKAISPKLKMYSSKKRKKPSSGKM